MADFDLRALSAPLDELRPQIDAAYKRLESKWDAILSELRRLAIPCTISYTYFEDPECPEDCFSLEFRKWKGSKRICLTQCQYVQNHYGGEIEEIVTPYEEWSGEQKLAMLQHVPDLFEVAVKQVNNFINKTKE